MTRRLTVDVEIDLTLGLPEDTATWLRVEYRKAQESCPEFTCVADFVSALVVLFHRTHLAAQTAHPLPDKQGTRASGGQSVVQPGPGSEGSGGPMPAGDGPACGAAPAGIEAPYSLIHGNKLRKPTETRT